MTYAQLCREAATQGAKLERIYRTVDGARFRAAEPPQDYEPGVEIADVAIADRGDGPYLSVKVRLFYLDEEDNNPEDGT